jgi:hypothetical protein
MRIQLTDPALVPELLEFLLGHMDCVATRISEDELEASLLGSRQLDANRVELDRRLLVWRAARAGGDVDVKVI